MPSADLHAVPAPPTTVATLRSGDDVRAVFACTRKDRLTARTGTPYLALELRDRTGAILRAAAELLPALLLGVAFANLIRGVEMDVTFTVLTMTHQASYDEPALIQVRHVRHRDIDYEDLTLVDHIVRDLISGDIDRDEARSRLARVVSSGHRLPRWAALAAPVAPLLNRMMRLGPVATLARAQERDLRSWLYGEESHPEAALVGALICLGSPTRRT